MNSNIYLAEEYGKEYIRHKYSEALTRGILQGFNDLIKHCNKEEVRELKLAFKRGKEVAEIEV